MIACSHCCVTCASLKLFYDLGMLPISCGKKTCQERRSQVKCLYNSNNNTLLLPVFSGYAQFQIFFLLIRSYVRIYSTLGECKIWSLGAQAKVARSSWHPAKICQPENCCIALNLWGCAPDLLSCLSPVTELHHD